MTPSDSNAFPSYSLSRAPHALVLATNPITPENVAGHRGAARIKRRAGSHGGVQRAQGLRQRVPRSPGDVEWAAGARELGAGVRRCRNARTRGRARARNALPRPLG